MCGFAGEFVFTGPHRADPAVANAMAARLTHRGPDEDGSFLSPDGRCAIGFRRLAVIDPPTSHQPMSSPDGSATVAFNGEIYNYRELRAPLSDEGVRFATAGDTEVLLHLYRARGEGLLADLTGMFAFALYDGRRRRLLLARDRLGQKPLWYAALPDRIVFASEAKALLRHPRLARRMHPPAITASLTVGYVPAPASAWHGIRKLPPGHRLTVGASVGPPAAYWRPQLRRVPAARGDLIGELRHTLAASVAARMVADVPLGALLSGGIDSSIIVALMCQAAGAAGGVRTFTAGFEDPRYDERPAARRVAAHCRTDHTELLVRPDAAEALDSLVALYDEPFADSSAIPTYLICRAARQHVTVALAGDGGDEVFAGYDRYRALYLAGRMSAARYMLVRLAAAALRPLAPPRERSRLRRFVRFADALQDPPSLQYFAYRRLFSPSQLELLLTADFQRAADTASAATWFCDLYEDGDFPDEVTRAQHHDLLTYLPDDLLVKTDIASMASSLELRAPMLDHRLVDLGLSLPLCAKVSRRQGKVLLKEAFRDLLPAAVFRQPKRGFGVPLARWLRSDLRQTLRETLLDEGLLSRGIFRREAMAALIRDHLSGAADHQHRLWALLILARWLAAQD
jgi:asparagine synthase (glutamine-hydrolysing)